MTTKQIAVLGAWHVHTKEYAEAFAKEEGIQVSCLWDEDVARGEAMARELGIPFEADLDIIWNNPAIEAVQITSRTNQHEELMLAAIAAGKHIFTEKVLTIHPEDAEEVVQAAQQAGICLTISFPHLSRPTLQRARAMMQEGDLGQVTYARVRNVHNGAIAGWLPDTFFDPETCGGGAMIDLGAHPMYTLAWLMGEPQDIRSVFTSVTGREVEDNAVSLLRYANGAIGVCETGFVSTHEPYVLELSGSKGALRVQGDQLFYATEKSGGKWQQDTSLPEALPSPLQRFAQALRSSEPGAVEMGDIGPQAALRLTHLMAQAYRR